MRPYFPERSEALASLARARLNAGAQPPLDWVAAAIEKGLILASAKRPVSTRRIRRLRRLGLLSVRGQ